MTYKITNFGNTRKLPYKSMNIEISRNCSISTEDADMAAALGQFHMISVKPVLDDMKRAELMRMAGEKGLEVSRSDTKQDLITKIKEV